ncbi:hypothetical protein [Pedobacter sp.]|uniref:hypothetical protein n=1 Tax=Pedobacter sp. TaxID=1411316 RepID=UPI003BABA1E4
MNKLYPTLILIVFFLNTSAQINISGNWNGFLGQNDKTWDFKLSMDLRQSGNRISGTAKFTSGDSSGRFVKYIISGTLNNEYMELRDVSVTDHLSQPDNWYWCKKIYTCRIVRSSDSLLVFGRWKNDGKIGFFNAKEVGNFNCPPGDIKMSLYSPQSNEVVKEKQKSAEPMPSRRTSVKEVVNTSSREVSLAFLDDQQVDGDTITVYYNGKAIITRQQLSHNPIEVTITVLPGQNNELIMFAHNQGSMGANTAQLILTDGKQRRQISMHSNMNVSQSLILTHK